MRFDICTPLITCSLVIAGAFLAARPQVTPPSAALLRDPGDWASIAASGPSWDNIITWADKWDDGLNLDIDEDGGSGNVPNNDHDVVTLACALAWRGTGNATWRDRTRDLISAAIAGNPESSLQGSALRPGRNLLSYVLAASTIDLSGWTAPSAVAVETAFRDWIILIAETRRWTGDFPGTSGAFKDYHERRPNNVGQVVGASRIAVDMYLGGSIFGGGIHGQHLVEAKQVFRGFLGHDASFNFLHEDFGGGASYDISWQVDQSFGNLEGVNPVGARITVPLQVAGGFEVLVEVDVDGCLPDDMRRLNEGGCGPCGTAHVGESIRCYNAHDSIDGASPHGRPGMDSTNYVWEALQGLVMQAYLLGRAGYGSFAWESSAIERTHRFLYVTYGLRAQDTWNDPTQPDNPACCNGSGNRNNVDDTWVPHIIEAMYNPSYLDSTNLVLGGRPGKNCGFADWWTIGL